jgi:hypothetical protein
MMRTKLVNDQLRQQRSDAKCLDTLFRRRIEQGANCAPFVSAAILDTVKEVYPLTPDDADCALGLGRIKLLVVAAQEPAGKSLEQCQKVTVTLTLDAGPEDYQTRIAYGVEGLRRARILRMTAEARDQGGLLSYEDLAYRLLNCGMRTIVRDVHTFRQRAIEVPSRGQQQDIGPGQTHRVQAVRLYLQGLEANEIARRLYHTLAAIENYVTCFARVALLVNQAYVDSDIAFVIRRSSALVAAYRQLYHEFESQPGARQRLQEILGRVGHNPEKGENPEKTAANAGATKKGGRRS